MLVAVELGQPVDGVRRAARGAVLAVPLLVGLEVAQPEVGREVDDLRPRPRSSATTGRGGAVRVGDDRGVDVLDRVEVELGQLQRHAVARVELVEAGAGVGARR